MEAKTYVLVHGAFHGGWCWKDVATRLRALGHTVYTPTQTGLGERSHLLRTRPTLETFVQDVEQVFRYEELDDVILVGHSFGGVTVTALADRIPERLRHLVYLDASLAQHGESTLDLIPADRQEAYHQRAIDTAEGFFVEPPDPAYLGISDPEIAAWIRPKLTPQPFQPFLDRLQLRNPQGNGVPATFIDCTNPPSPSIATSRERARSRPGWTYLEIPTGHNAMTLMPGELTQMLAALG
ncbi:MAG TPA: alpha/beta fold hydrolase [Ramlibacter sp.]|nr:alpha/beta fold hydrolase [Ramlibacter sp.]